MSTNFYRIPTEEEMIRRKEELLKDISEMEMSPSNIERNMSYIPFNDWERQSPWDKFIDETSIHLGKRSAGWKFIWNFHDNKYYSNKEDLLSFIRSGRVVDEYGTEQDVEEFIKMALDWGEPGGAINNKEYEEKQYKETGFRPFYYGDENYYDKIIDGLVVSRNTEFS